jgi:hypothetical protein
MSPSTQRPTIQSLSCYLVKCMIVRQDGENIRPRSDVWSAICRQQRVSKKNKCMTNMRKLPSCMTPPDGMPSPSTTFVGPSDSNPSWVPNKSGHGFLFETNGQTWTNVTPLDFTSNIKRKCAQQALKTFKRMQ